MDSYLVHAPSVDLEFDERDSVVFSEGFPVRDGAQALAPDRLVYRTVLWLGTSVDDGEVGLFHRLVRLELAAEVEICLLGLRENHDAARLDVEPVDDPGSLRRADASHLRVELHELGRESTFLVAGRRVDDCASGFVDDDYCLVFVDYVYVWSVRLHRMIFYTAANRPVNNPNSSAFWYNISRMETKLTIDTSRVDPEGEELEGEVECVDLDEPFVKPFGGVRYVLHVQVFGSELLVRGRLEQDFDLVCSRCGKDFDDTIKVEDFTASFEISEDSPEVDLTEELRESIILALPTYPVCDETCPGVEQTVEMPSDDRWNVLDNLNKQGEKHGKS